MEDPLRGRTVSGERLSHLRHHPPADGSLADLDRLTRQNPTVLAPVGLCLARCAAIVDYGAIAAASTTKSFTMPVPWKPTYFTPVTANGIAAVGTPWTEPTTIPV